MNNSQWASLFLTVNAIREVLPTEFSELTAFEVRSQFSTINAMNNSLSYQTEQYELEQYYCHQHRNSRIENTSVHASTLPKSERVDPKRKDLTSVSVHTDQPKYLRTVGTEDSGISEQFQTPIETIYLSYTVRRKQINGLAFVSTCYRMKYMMKKLKRDSISKTDIIKNIQYVVSVLEKVYDNEKRYQKYEIIIITIRTR